MPTCAPTQVCHICQEFIPERSDGRVEYREQVSEGATDGLCQLWRLLSSSYPVCQWVLKLNTTFRVAQGFWREVYCTRHTQDGTPQCCSCSRFQPKGESGAGLITPPACQIPS
jgi:hypothetical protein